MIQKFRAWHKELKMMLDVTALNFKQKLLFYDREIFEIVSGEYIGTSGEVESFDKFVIMQSTGLFDKNGVEVFEGDIIVAMSQGVKAIGEVKRRIDGYWLMYPSWQHGEFWHIVENVDTGETGVEVIGNVWEDGDLIDYKDAEAD
ncbi:YopX family protein [Streptococcus uberis]|uniref:YopX family protein n=1 Tax=Streptococcus uberis TaxID=1349 RepID=UPI001FF3312D|nr:YopX family protein [Streptococcus uberis]MCK1231830.1 YopX family protein [Streptococcus uberis]